MNTNKVVTLKINGTEFEFDSYVQEKLGCVISALYSGQNHEAHVVDVIVKEINLIWTQSGSIFLHPHNYELLKEVNKIQDNAIPWIKKQNSGVSQKEYNITDYFKTHFAKRRMLIKLVICMYRNEKSAAEVILLNSFTKLEQLNAYMGEFKLQEYLTY